MLNTLNCMLIGYSWVYTSESKFNVPDFTDVWGRLYTVKNGRDSLKVGMVMKNFCAPLGTNNYSKLRNTRQEASITA